MEFIKGELKEIARYLWERNYPLLLGVSAAALFYQKYHLIVEVDSTVKSLLTATGTASGTLLGFFFTVTTIISAIPTRRMRAVRENKKTFKLFLSYMKLAIWLCILVVSLTISDSFLRPIATLNQKLMAYNTVIIFASTWSWGASIRFAHIFIRSLYDKSEIS